MPTTTASLTISSADLTSSPINISATTNLTEAGTGIGLQSTTGLARRETESTNIYTLYRADDYLADKSSKVYLKNLSPISSEYFLVTVNDEPIGRLYGGDFALIPWSAIGGTKEVATFTFTGTWAAADTVTFDGVTFNTNSATTTSGNAMRAVTFPHWTAGGSADSAAVTLTSKESRSDLELNVGEFSIVDAGGSDATFTVATTTDATTSNPADIQITPSVATSMTLESMLIYQAV